MIKKKLAFAAVLLTGIYIYSMSSINFPDLTNVKKNKIFEVAKPVKNLQKENDITANIVELTNQQIKQKLKSLKADLQPQQYKNYSEFSPQELQLYNQQVQETIKLKKILFLRKYSHWMNI